MLVAIVTVMLDAFSGFPNPTWSLAEKDALALQERVNRIVQLQNVEPPRIPGLGYRGLVIKGLEVQGQAAEVRVFRAVVVVGSGSDARAYQDKDNSLEIWLVELGRAQLPADDIPDIFQRK